MTRKNILLIGCNSKIGSIIRDTPFMRKQNIYATSRKPSTDRDSKRYVLDLSDRSSVTSFLSSVKTIAFDAVVFCAATYDKDSETQQPLEQYEKDLLMNAMIPMEICRRIQLRKGASVILFGDAGLEHPKRGLSSYSLSKLALVDLIKLLAVEIAPHARAYLIRLGPIIPVTGDVYGYSGRGIVQIDAPPVQGLTKLLCFLLDTPDLFMTGTVIDYDGGDFLRRAASV